MLLPPSTRVFLSLRCSLQPWLLLIQKHGAHRPNHTSWPIWSAAACLPCLPRSERRASKGRRFHSRNMADKPQSTSALI